MARLASPADIVTVMYEHVDAARRQIGVAPIRLARGEKGSTRLHVSVMPGMRAKIPASIRLKLRGEEVEIPLLVHEDYGG